MFAKFKERKECVRIIHKYFPDAGMEGMTEEVDNIFGVINRSSDCVKKLFRGVIDLGISASTISLKLFHLSKELQKDSDNLKTSTESVRNSVDGVSNCLIKFH